MNKWFISEDDLDESYPTFYKTTNKRNSMNWLIPENELEREQRKILDAVITENSNMYIEGFPGSGKTILLLYAAKKLKDRDPSAKILFVEFTHALIKMIEAAIQQLPYHDIKVVTYYDYYDNISAYNSYEYILCDEVQDVPKMVIERMKSNAKRIIVAGDPNQSIYENEPRWGLPPCKKEELISLLQPLFYSVPPPPYSLLPSFSLTVIHRLSKFVMEAVDKFIPEMKILNGKVSMMKTNPKIRIWKGWGQPQEVSAIIEDAKSYLQVGDSIGILLPTHSKIQKFANLVLSSEGKAKWELVKRYDKPDYEKLNEHFDTNGIPMQYVANGFGDFATDKQKITLITYHSSKGLDFDRVYLPFCNHVDEYSKYGCYDKTLFMVAMTRSRGDLVISYTGELNHLVSPFKDDCTYRDLNAISNNSELDISETESVNKNNDDDLFGW